MVEVIEMQGKSEVGERARKEGGGAGGGGRGEIKR